MLSPLSKLLISVLPCVATISLLLSSSVAFQSTTPTNLQYSTRLYDVKSSAGTTSQDTSTSLTSRRDALQKSAGIAFSILLGGTTMSESANASYSAYTRREEDWKEREKNGGEFAGSLLRCCCDASCH